MADNVTLPGAGAVVAADDVSSVFYQRVKLDGGGDGASAPIPGDATAGLYVQQVDAELSNLPGRTTLRDQLFAQRYTVLADSLADGLAGFWTSTTANGGTATSSGGEGLVQTSANASGSAQIVSSTVPYFPGQVTWFNSAVRFNDTGSAGNTRRIGVFTVSGTTPQNGFYFELTSSALNAVVVNGGSATTVASGSWSRNSVAPFTLDTNYHSFELRYTANTVLFYVDNVLRHVHTGTSAAITATLNFPITIQSINTSGASNRLIAVRNCGIGRFGAPATRVDETGLNAVGSIPVGGGTPHDSVDSGNPIKLGMRALAHGTNPTAVAAGDRTDLLANRAGIPWVMGGHPNVITYGMSLTTAVSNTVIGPTVASGLKLVVTGITVILDNASTVFPSVVIGFGTANTPAIATTPGTAKILFAHPAMPAGGGGSRGDGSGIIGVGADDEELRVTTVGNAGGNGIYIVMTGYTIES